MHARRFAIPFVVLADVAPASIVQRVDRIVTSACLHVVDAMATDLGTGVAGEDAQ
ncbi:MAG TPA: hypothetical protein VFZ73_03530 [Gemmatimonadaceae bacterium]